jgi:hypothetical protein
MDIDLLQRFFFWCLVINTGIYVFTAVAVQVLRGFLFRVHKKLFGFDEVEVLISTQRYLATYKLLITVFNFTPWAALLIIE